MSSQFIEKFFEQRSLVINGVKTKGYFSLENLEEVLFFCKTNLLLVHHIELYIYTPRPLNEFLNRKDYFPENVAMSISLPVKDSPTPVTYIWGSEELEEELLNKGVTLNFESLVEVCVTELSENLVSWVKENVVEKAQPYIIANIEYCDELTYKREYS